MTFFVSHPAKNRFPISTFLYLNTILRTISHTFESTTNSCYCRSKSPQIINLVLYRTLESVRKQVLTSVLSKSSTFLTRQRQKLSLNGFLLTRHVTDFSVIIFNSFLLYFIDQSFFQPAFEFFNSL